MAANKRATIITTEHTLNVERMIWIEIRKLKQFLFFTNGCWALYMYSWPFGFVVDVLNMLHRVLEPN